MLDIKYRTNKVGVVPYRWRSRPTGEVLQFLVHLPNPKISGQESQLKWGLSRGTVRYKDDKGAWVDLHNMAALHTVGVDAIEDHWKTACHEAEEELGVAGDQLDISTRLDHGLLDYEPESGDVYPVHFFSAQLQSNVAPDVMKSKAKDSQDLAWRSLNELKEMVRTGSCPNERFKMGYIYILHVISEDLQRLR